MTGDKHDNLLILFYISGSPLVILILTVGGGGYQNLSDPNRELKRKCVYCLLSQKASQDAWKCQSVKLLADTWSVKWPPSDMVTAQFLGIVIHCEYPITSTGEWASFLRNCIFFVLDQMELLSALDWNCTLMIQKGKWLFFSSYDKFGNCHEPESPNAHHFFAGFHAATQF